MDVIRWFNQCEVCFIQDNPFPRTDGSEYYQTSKDKLQNLKEYVKGVDEIASDCTQMVLNNSG